MKTSKEIRIIVSDKEKENFQKLSLEIGLSESNLAKFFILNNFLQWDVSDIPVEKSFYIEEILRDIHSFKKYPVRRIENPKHILFSLIPFFEWGEIIKLNGEKK